jgi:hypothetical protein
MRLAILGALFLVLFVRTAVAGEDFTRKSLAGLAGVNVFIEPVKEPLDRSTIKTDVELRLRRAGIKVLDMETCQKTPGKPFLRVVGNTTTPATQIFAVSHDVELFQSVVLNRDKSISTLASTWRTGGVALGVGKANLVKGVRDLLRQDVDEFINDFLAANPRIKPGTEPDDEEDTPPKKKPKK